MKRKKEKGREVVLRLRLYNRLHLVNALTGHEGRGGGGVGFSVQAAHGLNMSEWTCDLVLVL